MKKQVLLSLMAMALPLTSWAADVLTVTVTGSGTDSKIVYAGDKTQDNLNVTVKDGNTTLKEGEYTIYYTLAGKETEVKNVGTYTAHVQDLRTGTRSQTGTGYFTVEKKR